MTAAAPQLTTTELETLAVMLHSAGKKMAAAKVTEGVYAWDDGRLMTEAIHDMNMSFYDIQRQAQQAAGAYPYAETIYI